MTFSEKIKALRDTKEISQEKLSEMTGVPLEKILQWENGETSSDIADILKICECFDTSIDYLLFDEIADAAESVKVLRKNVCDERGIRCEFPEISGFGHTVAGIIMLTIVLCGTCSTQYFHIRFGGGFYSEIYKYFAEFPFAPMSLIALFQFIWGINKFISSIRKKGLKLSLRMVYHENDDYNFSRHKVYKKVYDVIYIWAGITFILISIFGGYIIQYLEMKTYDHFLVDATRYSVTFPFSLVIILGFILLATGIYRVLPDTKRRMIERILEKDDEKRRRKEREKEQENAEDQTPFRLTGSNKK